MKVTFVLSVASLSGGIRVVAIYAKALSEMGHEVKIVSQPMPSIPFRRKIKSLLKGEGWPATPTIPSHLDGLGLDHRMIDKYRPMVESDIPDADVVIATWWETAEWVNALSPAKGVKLYLVQGHEVFPFCPVDRVMATYKMPLHKITISQWLADLMREEYGDSDVSLVENSVEHQQFFAAPRGKQQRPTIGILFHETPLKGVDVALEVIAALEEKFPTLRVIAFGSFPPTGAYKFPANLEFYLSPDQDSIRDLYSQCDVWLATSRSEGFNLTAMEAMACRTPVVSTRTGWPVEAISCFKNGVLADIDDTDALARGVEYMLTLDDSQWRAASEMAHQTVASSSWEASAQLFETTLVNALAKSRVKPVGLTEREVGHS
ncbi:D-inositol-3-phosphate glycosyltransferase [Pseudomonas fluorescens]|uniref:D-inositol-3-phosphate glycosyltransferase n=1 Tax=Pseudomonas fluorescens TaxID=294 RepID=A0A5E6PP99_PSEFL|nr:glycosyltransferase family 4 protein [Pseudomonas fluorescens]VVM43332.1 D-inositol-3-phosphate glycosyltransferase [Pseudomonas fluorescens]